MIRVTADRKVYVFRARVHHGLLGLLLIGLGVACCRDDWADRWWLADR